MDEPNKVRNLLPSEVTVSKTCDITSSRDSSADSRKSHKSYDSLDFFSQSKNFTLTDDMKMYCLESLSCTQSKNKTLPLSKGIYSTWTSHWVRNKKVSFHLYTLLKVKRWHLIDENFLFDPFKKCNSNAELTPVNTLWRLFPGNDQTQHESELSLDGILRVHLQDKVKESLKTLDFMLEPIAEETHRVTSSYEAVTIYRKLDANKHLARGTFYSEYNKLVQSLTHAIMRTSTMPKGNKVPEKVYRKAFQAFINCLKACVGGPIKEEVQCDDDVDGFLVEKITIPVKMNDGKGKKHALEICSKPDLFVYQRTNPLPGQPRTVLAVVEAKGKQNGQPVHSDDEDDDVPSVPEATEDKCLHRPSLGTVEEEDDDIDDDQDDFEIEETSLELLINETPAWLESTRNLPPYAQLAIKRFLPQLIGDMWCASRSRYMQPLKSKNGLLFGIGLVGFEVYFVTVLDSCRDSSDSVVNTESAFTNVFVTRPFHLLAKKDRRIIMKILAGSFNLHDSLYYIE